MALSSPNLSSLQINKSPMILSRRHASVPITASVSGSPSIPATSVADTASLPTKQLPGDYGLPFFGPIKDRLDYFYNQGKDEFFKSKVEKYKSTVFRTNMPPGPFISSDPKVVALLDGKSFSTLFDMSKVEKKNVFTGTFMPSTDLTGGYRILSYLDPSEPSHAKLKQLVFFLLKSRRDRVIPEFQNAFGVEFKALETEVKSKGKASMNERIEQGSFNFLGQALCGQNPSETELGKDGPTMIGKWVLLQLGPVLTLGLPKVIEELLLHTFPLPSFIAKKDYQKLYNFFYESSTFFLDEAEKVGVSRDEACHNLVFTTCFNSYGGMKILFPGLLKWINSSGSQLQSQLAKEIRSAVKSAGGNVTMAALGNMPLTSSVVYETLRIEPPVTAQYGRAKKDLVIESHDAAFEIKKGEMLFGYQPFATRDAKIFDKPEEFVGDRFVGDGEKLLKHVLWSNGPETENPTIANKQCAGKDFVVLASKLFLTEFFLRFDSFEADVSKSALGPTVTVTSLTKASY